MSQPDEPVMNKNNKFSAYTVGECDRVSLGCWKDTSSRAIAGAMTTYPRATLIEQCELKAALAGLLFAIVRHEKIYISTLSALVFNISSRRSRDKLTQNFLL